MKSTTELDTVVGVAGFSCGICSSIKKGGRWHCKTCKTSFCSHCVHTCVLRETQQALKKSNYNLDGPWKTALDVPSRRLYFYNMTTGERTWYRPARRVEERPRSMPASKQTPQEDLPVHTTALRQLVSTISTKSLAAEDSELLMRAIQNGGLEDDEEVDPRKLKQLAELLHALRAMEEVRYECKGQGEEAGAGHEAVWHFHAALTALTKGTYRLPADVWHMEELSKNADKILALFADVHAWNMSRFTSGMFVDLLMTLTTITAWYDAMKWAMKLDVNHPIRAFLDTLAARNAEWYSRWKGTDSLQYSVACLDEANQRRDMMMKAAKVSQEKRDREKHEERMHKSQAASLSHLASSSPTASEGAISTASVRSWPVKPRRAFRDKVMSQTHLASQASASGPSPVSAPYLELPTSGPTASLQHMSTSPAGCSLLVPSSSNLDRFDWDSIPQELTEEELAAPSAVLRPRVLKKRTDSAKWMMDAKGGVEHDHVNRAISNWMNANDSGGWWKRLAEMPVEMPVDAPSCRGRDKDCRMQ